MTANALESHNSLLPPHSANDSVLTVSEVTRRPPPAYSSHSYDRVNNLNHQNFLIRTPVDFSHLKRFRREPFPIKDTKSSLQRKKTSRRKNVKHKVWPNVL